MDVIHIVFVLLWVCFGHILAENCPTGWHRYGESCYLFSNTTMDWYQARSTCVESRATLAYPTSQSEQDYIWDIFNNKFPSNNLWIGCYAENAGWQNCPLRDDGTGYEYWADGEPRYSVNVCVQMWYNFNGRWDDCPCSYSNYAVCELHVRSTLVPAQPTVESISALPPQTGNNVRLTPQCLLHHAMTELMGNGVVSCGKYCRSHPPCHSFNLLEQDCPPGYEKTAEEEHDWL